MLLLPLVYIATNSCIETHAEVVVMKEKEKKIEWSMCVDGMFVY